jgi:hypothetical protein
MGHQARLSKTQMQVRLTLYLRVVKMKNGVKNMSFINKVELKYQRCKMGNQIAESKAEFLSSEDALKKQAKVMTKFALTLPPSSLRAQCYTIANYKLDNGETIAERLRRDHSSLDHALRAAQLMADAGCATEIKNKNPRLYGTFTFLDGSELRS